MTTLIHPTNKQPCEFVASVRGHIALRCDYVTPQVRWFTLTQIEAVNPVTTCAIPQNFDSGLDYCYPQPLLTVVLTPEMAASVNASAGVEIVVRKPAQITVYHESMKVA